MREFWLCAIVGLTMFAVGRYYGGAEDVERSAVDLPAAMAYQPPRDSRGNPNPNYQDLAIVTLQYALDATTDELKKLQEHDADIHRGTMVPSNYRCPE